MMFKLILWSTPVLFSCIVPADEASGMLVHIKLQSCAIEFISEPLASHEEALSLLEAICQPQSDDSGGHSTIG